MSSLRNSLHRRNHKERSQLGNRARFGILEKHKDYVLRARDYHSKQDRITRLKQKAADRNKDEFYFGMVRQKTQGGVHVQGRGNSALPVDMVKVLKSQDENYIRTMRTAGLKKIDKIKAQLTVLADLVKLPTEENNGSEDVQELDAEELEILRKAGVINGHSKGRKKLSTGQKSKHIIFVEDEGEARSYPIYKTGTAEKIPAVSERGSIIDLGWKSEPVLKKAKIRRSKALVEDNREEQDVCRELDVAERIEAAKQHRGRLLKELSARLARDTQLRYAERELEMQKLLMGKGGRKKLKGVEKVEGGDEKDEDEGEDELDARRGMAKRSKPAPVNEKLYKPWIPWFSLMMIMNRLDSTHSPRTQA